MLGCAQDEDDAHVQGIPYLENPEKQEAPVFYYVDGLAKGSYTSRENGRL